MARWKWNLNLITTYEILNILRIIKSMKTLLLSITTTIMPKNMTEGFGDCKITCILH